MVKVPLDPSRFKSPLKRLRWAAETFPFLPTEMQPIIGLEIHVQLNTKRKLFSCTHPPVPLIDDLAAPMSVDAAPNTMVGYHDIGLPGSLPVLNKEAVLLAVKAALAMGCTVNRKSSFDRKHYFYKDLATGYQITQRYHPLAVNGKIALHPRENGRLFDQPFVVPIDRVQLEQDTAQSIESIFKYESYRRSLINYNRSSAPLIEIITPPVLPTPTLAGAAFTKIIELLQVTETSTADLHLGAMRCDANVSLGLNSPRVEIKNLNGSRAVREACTAELQCQVQLYKQKKAIISSTKRWTGKNLEVMRTKAVDKDYRYMPDADLPPIVLDDEFIAKARASIPLLPDYLVTILLSPPHNLTFRAAKRLSVKSDELEYYNIVLDNLKGVKGQMVADWVISQLYPLLKKSNLTIRESPFTVNHMIDLIKLLAYRTINIDGAIMLLKAYFPPHEPVWELPSEHPLLNSLLVEPDNLREQIIQIIKKSEPKPVRDGMKTLEQFYMGQLMKELRGRVDASRAREIIREEAAALLDIVPPPKKGGRYEVRFKSGI